MIVFSGQHWLQADEQPGSQSGHGGPHLHEAEERDREWPLEAADHHGADTTLLRPVREALWDN